MGIISKFGGSYVLDYVSTPTVEWSELVSLQDFELILQESHHNTIVIFKHSTRCDLSNAMLKNFERRYDFADSIPKPYYLDLIANRDVSDAIASVLKIRHESPQVIFVKDGEVVRYANHDAIKDENLKKRI